jgi:hypothetical protein
MNHRPFEVIRWESAMAHSPELLARMLAREGLQAEPRELPPRTRTPEMRFDRTAVRVLVAGHIQYSFPGYGVIELHPGDMLEIFPGVLHDVIVAGSQQAVLLEAFRE